MVNLPPVSTESRDRLIERLGGWQPENIALADFISTIFAAVAAVNPSLAGQISTGINKLVSLDGSGTLKQANPFAFEPITNYGAVTAVDCTAALNLAIAAHKLIYIPAGVWRWTGTIVSTGVTWLIDPGASFPDLPTVGPYGQTNLDTLGGRIFRQSNNATTKQGWRIGDGDPWPENYRQFSVSIAEFSATAQFGNLGVGGYSRSSDNPTVNQGTIGGEFLAINDDTANLKPVFGAYKEAWRTANTVGAALGDETEAINLGALNSLTPYTVRSLSSKDCISYVAASGGGIGGATTATAAYVMWANGADFERGIIVMKDALLSSGPMEFFTTYTGTKLAWYDDTNLAASYVGDTGQVWTIRNNTAASGHETEYRRKRANGTTATGALDEVHVDRYAGWDGTALYYGAYTQCLQVAAFAAGLARFRYDIAAKNDSGAYKEISLNGAGNNAFSSTADNDINLGLSTNRWARVFSNEFRPGPGTAIWTSGAGTPEGATTAPVGSLFTRTDGGANTTLYVKESGAGNTGWVAK